MLRTGLDDTTLTAVGDSPFSPRRATPAPAPRTQHSKSSMRQAALGRVPLKAEVFSSVPHKSHPRATVPQLPARGRAGRREIPASGYRSSGRLLRDAEKLKPISVCERPVADDRFRSVSFRIVAPLSVPAIIRRPNAPSSFAQAEIFVGAEHSAAPTSIHCNSDRKTRPKPLAYPSSHGSR